MSEVLDYANQKIAHFRGKADHNKNEAMLCYITILVCSLSAPLFISLAEGKILSKIVPSILSVLAAGFTSWLQLRKPQKLWSIYRNAERLIEYELTKYQYSFGQYNDSRLKDEKLPERIAEIAFLAHSEWLTAIPNPESIPTSFKQGES